MMLFEVILSSLLAFSNWHDAAAVAKAYVIRNSTLTDLEKTERLYDLVELGMDDGVVNLILGKECIKVGLIHGFFTGAYHIMVTTYPMDIFIDRHGKVAQKRRKVARDAGGRIHRLTCAKDIMNYPNAGRKKQKTGLIQEAWQYHLLFPRMGQDVVLTLFELHCHVNGWLCRDWHGRIEKSKHPTYSYKDGKLIDIHYPEWYVPGKEDTMVSMIEFFQSHKNKAP